MINNPEHRPDETGRVALVHEIKEDHAIVSMQHNEFFDTFGQFYKYLEPIPLTKELVTKCGFQGLPHFTVSDAMKIDIGRRRQLSLACIGTPNEMLFVLKIDEGNVHPAKKVKDAICIHNFDYDGKLYLHKLQNIFIDFTGRELPINI